MIEIEDAIDAISAVLENDSLSREMKIAKLKKLAMEVWDTVFPERGTPNFQKLSNEECLSRWRSLEPRLGKAKDDFRMGVDPEIH
ncbi:MAG: hypothetical protein QM765_16475 [Myxococcales bacterium]